MGNIFTDAGDAVEQFYDWQADVVSDAWDQFSGKDDAEASADAIAGAAEKDQQYNFPDVNGVLGSQNVTTDENGNVTINQSLNPQQQGLLSGLYGDAGTSRQRIEDALYSRSTSRLDPQWQDRENATRTRLYNQGLQEGDAAFDRGMRDLGFARDDAYAGARNTAITAGGQEQSRLIDAIMKTANPGLDRYWGQPNATDAAVAQGNIMAQVPSGLDAILGLAPAAASAFAG